MAQLAPAFGWWIWVGDAQRQLGTFGFRTSYGEEFQWCCLEVIAMKSCILELVKEHARIWESVSLPAHSGPYFRQVLASSQSPFVRNRGS